MPTYEYQCDKCDQQFEVFQRITDDPVEVCSECGGHVKRLIAATNFILKGSGWHKTDYATPSNDADKKPQACAPENMGPACDGCPAKGE